MELWGISVLWFICTFIDHPHSIWEWWAIQDSSMHAMAYAATWTTPLRQSVNNIPCPCRNRWAFATLPPKSQMGSKKTVKELQRGGRGGNLDSFLHFVMHLLWLRFYHLTRRATNVRKEGQTYRANPERVHSSIISFLEPSFNAQSTYTFGNPRERQCNVADSQQGSTKTFLLCLLW